MSVLKKPIVVETTFGSYELTELIGEGGAGRVYGGTSFDGTKVAVKVLTSASNDKRRRFKNEIAFLARNRHPNIVSVTDHGVANDKTITGPFYVMRRYDCNLRDGIKAAQSPQDMLQIFGLILNGVEAAHFQSAVHRDLKPENILFDSKTKVPAVADFGIASFTDDLVATAVATGPGQRLANFMYAAPEQRTPGAAVGVGADIYALGLMLNELFTGSVPHGTEYRLIGKSHGDFGYLDAIVGKMIRQAPGDRYSSIADLKGAISLHHSEFVTLQKLSKINDTVIPAGEVDDPLAYTPLKLINFDWNNGVLDLHLDRPVHEKWKQAFLNMGNFTSVMGIGPDRFQFSGSIAKVAASANDVQRVIDYFKEWLPRTTQVLKNNLENEARQRQYQMNEKLKHEKAAEELRLSVLRGIKL